MAKIILIIYDYLRAHRMVGVLSFVFVTILLIISVSRIEYKEDISDFLPLDTKWNNAMKVFQEISGADKVVAVFQSCESFLTDPDEITSAIDYFVGIMEEEDSDGMVKNLMSQVDFDGITKTMDFVYENIPYFLTDDDYYRIESLLNDRLYVTEQLKADKRLLMFPSGGLLTGNIQRDPLNLFSPTVNSLQESSEGLDYETYEGYIFSPDMQKAFVVMTSPFGSSETENNARLVNMLRRCADATTEHFNSVEIHITGGPVIAVGNANRIKIDSIWSVSCALFLILVLLFSAFRSVRNLLLIALAIGWGWLFGLGCLSVVDKNISVIILGMSSVVLGIAVNYPLHLIAHFPHATGKRDALREIVGPLLVGNITTVGAFLALVPLQSSALRDLGLFSSFLLIGTILFVLLYLPHIAIEKQNTRHVFFSKFGDVTLENNKWVVWAVVILTIVLGVFSLRTTFDVNISHINYITKEQESDMEYFSNMMQDETSTQKVYVVSSDTTMDRALDSCLRIQECLNELTESGLVTNRTGCGRFLCPPNEQSRRLRLWGDFIRKYRTEIEAALRDGADAQGFTSNSFDDFYAILDADYEVMPFEYFEPLDQIVYSNFIIADDIGSSYNVVDVLSVDPEHVSDVEDRLSLYGVYSFDVDSMNGTIASNLSSDFNYIGWACGCVVFIFLWLSMGSIELAILSFIPMAVSWLWILGLMAIFGIQFNIVNVILATFIFGQGDDYTIFMTEGSCYEYAYRRKILGSYKNSIILSALIMFIGIGTLIFAKHPAMSSLAQVTIVGMLSVVLMAYLFPPLIYKWLVYRGGKYRERPLTLRSISVGLLNWMVVSVQLVAVYVLGIVLCTVFRSDKNTCLFRHCLSRILRFDLTHISGVKFNIVNEFKESSSNPAIVICNRISNINIAVLMTITQGFMPITEAQYGDNIIFRQIYKWLAYPILQAASESEFYECAYHVAVSLRADIIPVTIHGTDFVFPDNGLATSKGTITAVIGRRITTSDNIGQNGYKSQTLAIMQYFSEEYCKLTSNIESVEYWYNFVKDRYKYKGYEITRSAVRNLKACRWLSQWKNVKFVPEGVTVEDTGWGESALLYALAHNETNVIAIMEDEERATVLKYSAEGVVDNLQIEIGQYERKD